MNKKVEENEEQEETVGQGNPRDERMKQITETVDERRASDEDYKDVEEGDHEKTVEIEEERPRDEQGRFIAKEELKAEAPAKRKFKVNGEEIELSEDEVAEWVQKGKSADAKFQEAARIKREAEEKIAQASVKPAPVQETVDDDRALARALQMGSEEEAAAVIKRLRSAPSVKPDEIVSLVEKRFAFQDAKQKFLDEYKDVMADEYWRNLVFDREEQLAYKGEKPGYDRMKSAGDWARDLKKKATPAEASTQQKLERKESLSNTQVKQANIRQAPAETEDKEESTHDVINGMAKARGQMVRSVGNL